MLIVCPHCHQTIKISNTQTYYARHKQEIQKKYKENTKNPQFLAKRREIARKSYHKRKQECQNQ